MNDRLIDEIVARIQAMQRSAMEQTARWKDWSVNIVPKSCPVHGQPLVIDEHSSIAASREEMTVVWSHCPTCLLQQQATMDRERLIRFGVPKELSGASMANFETPSEFHAKAKSAVLELVERNQGFLVLSGSYGLGKSHLAVAAMRLTPGRCRFITQQGLLCALRATYRDSSAEDVVENCKTARLLVLDDYGLSVGGKDEEPMIHDILNYRHGNMLPTIITTNLDGPEFGKTIGKRMADRLRESASWVDMQGPSMRTKNRAKYKKTNPPK